MRLASRIACVALLLAPALAAPPDVAVELPGTVWSTAGRMILRATAAGRSARSSGRSGPVVLDFSEEGRFRLVAAVLGEVTGTWEPHERNERRAVGVLDEETLRPFVDELEAQFRKVARRELGVRLTADFTMRRTAFDARLSRTGEELRTRTRVRLGGRLQARGRRLRLRIALTLRAKGGQDGA